MTPVPSLMCLVRSAAAAMKTSGDAIVSQPRAVVLSDPGLVEPQVVQPLNRFKVSLQRQGGIVAQ